MSAIAVADIRWRDIVCVCGGADRFRSVVVVLVTGIPVGGMMDGCKSMVGVYGGGGPLTADADARTCGLPGYWRERKRR